MKVYRIKHKKRKKEYLTLHSMRHSDDTEAKKKISHSEQSGWLLLLGYTLPNIIRLFYSALNSAIYPTIFNSSLP